MKKGFTLIELLVVVLIIGILSSVALPQYQKAVLKSRASEAWANLKNINMAVNAYCLETSAAGEQNFANIREELAVDVKDSKNFSYTGKVSCNGVNNYIYANFLGGKDFKLGMRRDTGARLCEGSACKDIGFVKSGSSGSLNCYCGTGSGCYYAD